MGESSNSKHPIYAILPDGHSFGSAEGTVVLALDVPITQITGSAFEELENGEISILYEDVTRGRTPGTVIPLEGLLALRAMVGKIQPQDLKDLNKMTEFFDAATNLDIWD